MNETKCIDLLAAHGIKPTANRIVIVRVLAEMDRPLSLTELEYKIMTIDKSNVFRALSIFKDHHLVHVIEDGGDGVRYELCRSHCQEGDDDVHVHFYCEHCHQTFCMEGTPIPSVPLPAGYVLTSINYMMKGLCPECARHKFRS